MQTASPLSISKTTTAGHPAPAKAGAEGLDPTAVIAMADKLASDQRLEEVVLLYREWLAVSQSPLKYIIQFNLGVTLTGLGRLGEAEHVYRDAIFQKPDFAQAWFNLGSVIERQGRGENAITIWQSMLDHPLVGPEQNRELFLMVVNSMGRLLEEMREYQRAEEKLRYSLDVEPDQPKVIQHYIHLRQKQCVWPFYPLMANLSKGEMLKSTSPLALLSATDDPGMQLAAAMHFVNDRVNYRVPELATQGYAHQKIRIGFLSSDFCLHAVSLLTVELFELFDKSRFELYGFCWSREDGSAMRARVQKAMNHFIRINTMSDEEAARCIRSHEIDVLVDLQGLTSGARPDILAWRPAPVQLTYLGFPGPTGLPGIDYVIADRFLIPEDEKPFYSENPLYLPKVFQSCDRQRPIGILPTRAQCGLPEDKFVFCSFNNNYKITPEVFAVWMRILKRVPDSVLWLLADNTWAQHNMIQHAREAGVDESRLLFAPRVAPQDYLARYTAADLFLDAYPFNGGTTANDALWMGLPVLTRSGRTFASRMAGSLLTALELPELITFTIEDYEEKAVQLATHPETYKPIRQKLAEERHASPLFDMPQFVKDFEVAVLSVVKKV